MPSSSEVTAGVERRTSSRRADSERRDSGRTDPAPRRIQLRRKTDVVDYLGAPRRRGSASEPTPLRRLPKRPLKTWIDRGLGKDKGKGKLFS
jgi:hypothetical protein